MGRAKIFEGAVLLHPTEEEAKRGEVGKIVVKPTAVLAQDENGARLKLARLIPQENIEQTDRLEVVVRPFCR